MILVWSQTYFQWKLCCIIAHCIIAHNNRVNAHSVVANLKIVLFQDLLKDPWNLNIVNV